ncbi:MAG: ABC transporter ATP-binding protein [Peptococcaceae bacterium]|mgnify:CR=1 FL=1|nr:ABC transporter ATP-binding protein [Peptococcaceae bacterium]
MTPLIKVEDLKQTAGKQIILNSLSFQVSGGECLGLFGARGAGKTTLLHILAGVNRFKSGRVEILGCDIKKNGAYKKQMGLITQKQSLFKDLRAYENLDFIAALKGADKNNIPDLVQRLALHDILGEPVAKLDAGVYQRLSMACALLNEPRVLIADDLINNIDPFSQSIIHRELDSFLEGGGACVWGFSRIEFCRYTSKVGWLEKGTLTPYSPQAVLEEWDRRWHHIAQQKEQQSGESHA